MLESFGSLLRFLNCSSDVPLLLAMAVSVIVDIRRQRESDKKELRIWF